MRGIKGQVGDPPNNFPQARESAAARGIISVQLDSELDQRWSAELAVTTNVVNLPNYALCITGPKMEPSYGKRLKKQSAERCDGGRNKVFDELCPSEAMIAAGAKVLYEGLPDEFSWESSYARELATKVFLAMVSAQKCSR